MKNNLVAYNFEKIVPSNQPIHDFHDILLDISSCKHKKILFYFTKH